MDKTDLKLVASLEQQGRISFASLGEQVGLSKSPCWKRVNEMENAGVITGYQAKLDPFALGLHIHALVHVVVDFERYQAFEAAIEAHTAVRACYAVTGEYDYVVEVFARDIDDFDQLLRANLSKIPGVQRFQTAIATRTVKQQGPFSLMLPGRSG
ncbi:Lrp/AsnC family transcriptional regulator [Aestuariibacter halophilus]|uniref:Lrp/AsnC family transcriptional regulator n=1 Tax=Fluctibacter halophilus TaxID=226011 RepID=A0ABS8GAJ5_9ALTE|nr:Lrp/AsnC family transcriptional regulator [Aestuariibacter halophilus]MCC2617562.1 Lrp/AsnC family transcriptional regulator [Aestuariibacter halophilus]